MAATTPERQHRAAARLIAASRAMVTQPNDMAVRKAFVWATFNLDAAASAIVLIADSRLRLLAAVKRAEQFVEGFQGDPAQDGLAELLAELRGAHGDDPGAGE